MIFPPRKTPGQGGFVALTVLLLALILLLLVLGLSRHVAGVGREIRLVEEQQRARLGTNAVTNVVPASVPTP